MMGAPYSDDLRRKVIQACERRRESQREIAELFSVSLSFVESVWRHYCHSGGEVVPRRRRAGRHSRLDAASLTQLRKWLKEQPDLTLKELIDRLASDTGIAVSEPTMCRVLQQLGMRRKKRLYMPRSGTARAYIWHAVGTGEKLPASLRKS
jgi:transposase